MLAHPEVGGSIPRSTVVSVLVSSVALSKLGTSGKGTGAGASNVDDFLTSEYEIEWLSAEFNFLIGL